jgi:hypothetical protein
MTDRATAEPEEASAASARKRRASSDRATWLQEVQLRGVAWFVPDQFARRSVGPPTPVLSWDEALDVS